MGEISAYQWAAPDYPWAAHANCSLVMLQQTMGNLFQCYCCYGVYLILITLTDALRMLFAECMHQDSFHNQPIQVDPRRTD